MPFLAIPVVALLVAVLVAVAITLLITITRLVPLLLPVPVLVAVAITLLVTVTRLVPVLIPRLVPLTALIVPAFIAFPLRSITTVLADLFTFLARSHLVRALAFLGPGLGSARCRFVARTIAVLLAITAFLTWALLPAFTGSGAR